MILYFITYILFANFICPFAFFGSTLVMLYPSPFTLALSIVAAVVPIIAALSRPLHMFGGGMLAFALYKIVATT